MLNEIVYELFICVCCSVHAAHPRSHALPEKACKFTSDFELPCTSIYWNSPMRRTEKCLLNRFSTFFSAPTHTSSCIHPYELQTLAGPPWSGWKYDKLPFPQKRHNFFSGRFLEPCWEREKNYFIELEFSWFYEFMESFVLDGAVVGASENIF